MTFNDQYKDMRWIEKRNRIMERDSFRCRICGINYNTMHAHHLYYERGKMIWECEDSALVTLCTKHHSIIHKDLKKLSGIIAFQVLAGKIDFGGVIDIRANDKLKNKLNEMLEL